MFVCYLCSFLLHLFAFLWLFANSSSFSTVIKDHIWNSIVFILITWSIHRIPCALTILRILGLAHSSYISWLYHLFQFPSTCFSPKIFLNSFRPQLSRFCWYLYIVDKKLWALLIFQYKIYMKRLISTDFDFLDY